MKHVYRKRSRNLKDAIFMKNHGKADNSQTSMHAGIPGEDLLKCRLPGPTSYRFLFDIFDKKPRNAHFIIIFE